jgi:hypothetical protein
MIKPTKTLVVEAALAGLFLAATTVPASANPDAHAGAGAGHKAMKKSGKKMGGGKVHCLGVNSCKGTSECAVEGGSSCKGMNACKGHGWISLTKKECAAQKGTVQGAKKDAPAANAPAKH